MAGESQPDEAERREIVRQRLLIIDAIRAVIARPDELLTAVAASGSDDDARQRVMATFSLDEMQAVAALDLQVRRFTPQSRQRIEQERAALLDQVRVRDA